MPVGRHKSSIPEYTILDRHVYADFKSLIGTVVFVKSELFNKAAFIPKGLYYYLFFFVKRVMVFQI
jgi:hypothetical protein